jgi:predicted MPP superfamily phosphohydrolase
MKKAHIDLAHRQGVRLALFFGIVAFVFGLMVKAYHNATHPIVVEENLTLPKRNSTRDSLRIVMMSDTHFGEMIGKRAARRFVELSNAQNPDMVVIVGDLLDYESRFAEKEHIEDDLRGLRAPLGVYIVNGNHEYRANRMAKFRWFEKTGAVHLTDSVVSPDSTFYLVGRDDYVNKNRKPLAAILNCNNHDLPIIALDHQPWSFAEAVMNGVDLGLSGHTHDGQLWPYPWVLKFVYECSHGRYKKGPTQFYVSSGIGFAGPPYRVGTHSELVVLNIKFE